VAARGVPVERLVFVESNCEPATSGRELAMVEALATTEPRIAAVVAFLDLTSDAGRPAALEALARSPLVRGVRQNIQGQPPGFCLKPAFVRGIAELGRRGLTFDLCATHDQLSDVTALVARCPETRFVLDHCGKPPIRERRVESWAAAIAQLAEQPNVCCKLSGLLTEADLGHWRSEDLEPYTTHVVGCFGTDRLMFGSDWPVLTLTRDGTSAYAAWFAFTQQLTAGWNVVDRRRFYRDTAARVYSL
jgi:L-fuconolactonase